MKNKNIGINGHVAQRINSVLVLLSDLILQRKHVDAIQSKFSESCGKVYLIRKWNDNQEFPELYKKDMKTFETSFAMIESGLDEWNQKLWC